MDWLARIWELLIVGRLSCEFRKMEPPCRLSRFGEKTTCELIWCAKGPVNLDCPGEL